MKVSCCLFVFSKHGSCFLRLSAGLGLTEIGQPLLTLDSLSRPLSQSHLLCTSPPLPYFLVSLSFLPCCPKAKTGSSYYICKDIIDLFSSSPFAVLL